jgi:hypothetical protein
MNDHDTNIGGYPGFMDSCFAEKNDKLNLEHTSKNLKMNVCKDKSGHLSVFLSSEYMVFSCVS